MRFLRSLPLFLCLVGAALSAGCAATGSEPVEASNETGKGMIEPAAPATDGAAAPEVYRFYPGDELRVAAVNRPELDVTARVDPFGYIAYPYLGQVLVKDLSAVQVAERLSRGLQEGGYYTRPLLTVALIASKEQLVYVLGEVKKPGTVPVVGNVNILTAISRAGGQTHDAEMSTVLWIRTRYTPPGVVKINLASFGDPRSRDPKIPNLTMMPGDVLYIPDSVIVSVERFMVRILHILQPFVEFERGIVLYPDVADILRGDTRQSRIININTSAPLP